MGLGIRIGMSISIGIGKSTQLKFVSAQGTNRHQEIALPSMPGGQINEAGKNVLQDAVEPQRSATGGSVGF